MLRTPAFYLMWFVYACGAGAGLMIIAKLAAIASVQAGVSLGFVLVASLTLGNGFGRILAARFVHPPQRRVAPALALPPAPESRPAAPRKRTPVGV
jgi:hypothetical protein